MHLLKKYNQMKHYLARLSGLAVLAVVSQTAFAEAPDWRASYATSTYDRAATMQVDDLYPAGIDRHDLDDHTEILGWHLGRKVYFGRQDGMDSGLTVVWQQTERQQVSLSKDGLRLTRRF